MRAENPRLEPYPGVSMVETSQRYLFFVYVDEESLDSIVEGGGDYLDSGWVNLVRCYDELDYDLGQDAEDEQSYYERDEQDELDGEDEEDEEIGRDDGWMMIMASMINGDFYDAVGTTIEYWDAFYMPPPDVVNW